jgi:phenylacetic acid degradation operon negative regulatory protein
MPDSRGRSCFPAQKRLDDFRQQGRVQAGSLIISVFGDAVLPRGSRIWLGSLIRCSSPWSSTSA